MKDTIITDKKNGRYYISSEWKHCIETIIFFDDTTQSKVLELKNRKIITTLNNHLYNSTYRGEAEAKQIILTHPAVRKLKEDLKSKSNYYLSKNDEYTNRKITLYININIECIEIEEQKDTIKKVNDGYFEIYKNYILKNLSFLHYNLNHIFFKNEDVDKLTYSDFNRMNLKKIDDEIEKEKSFHFTQFQNYLNRLKELKNEGFTYIGHAYKLEEATSEAVKIFSRSYQTEERKTRILNINFLKNNIYNEKKIIALFNRFGIDINKVKFEEEE